MRQVSQFTNRKIVILSYDAPVWQAARAMNDRDIGSIIVGDQKGHIIGIVTDRDIACYFSSEDPLLFKTPLSEIMTADPVTIHESADIDLAIKMMVEFGIRRVPVVRPFNGGLRCSGIITLDDLIANKMITDIQAAELIKTQIRRQMTPGAFVRSQKSEERSEARKDESEFRFNKKMADQLGVPSELAGEIAGFLLSHVVRRLHFASAADLVAQLPKRIQDRLLDLPAGPDRSISADKMIQGLTEKFSLNADLARATVKKFFETFQDVIGHSEIMHVASQLP